MIGNFAGVILKGAPGIGLRDYNTAKWECKIIWADSERLEEA